MHTPNTSFVSKTILVKYLELQDIATNCKGEVDFPHEASQHGMTRMMTNVELSKSALLSEYSSGGA